MSRRKRERGPHNWKRHANQSVFGAMMEVELVNDGPVTILLDSGRLF
jgi:D-Tyr-tRNAtyr deacylase